MEIILGKEGNQCFPITSKFVSRKHARVVYDPAKRSFTIDDLNSANGTYVLNDENGLDTMSFYRITHVTVPLGTWICLGGTEIGTGQLILVDHLLAQNPDDWSAEFRVINAKHHEYKKELEKLEAKQKRQQLNNNLLRVGITAGLLAIVVIFFSNVPGLTIAASLGGATFCSLFALRDNKRDVAKRLKKNASTYFVCPKCGQPLNEFSINRLSCPYCKAQ